MLILRIIAIIGGLSLISCVNTQPSLLVKQDRISPENIGVEDGLVSFQSENEFNRHLHPRERNNVGGEYFTFLWDDLTNKVSEQEPTDLQLIFYYRTTNSKATILKKIWKIKGEIQKAQILQFAYDKKWIDDKGEILSWKTQITQGKQVLVEEKSYLWKERY